MRTRIISSILFILGVTSLIAQIDKPNIIFILTDDLGYGDVGILFQNQREGIQIKTPELDQMAMAGTIMSRHYCPAPICAPSWASFDDGDASGPFKCTQYAI